MLYNRAIHDTQAVLLENDDLKQIIESLNNKIKEQKQTITTLYTQVEKINQMA